MKMNKKRKNKLKKVAHICNKQAKFTLPTFIDALIKAFDVVLSDDEIDFLLKIDTDKLSSNNLKERLELPDKKFSEIFNGLIQKGVIWSEELENETLYYIPPMMLGWFEMSFHGDKITSEKENFSNQITKYFETFRKFNMPIIRALINIWIKLRPPMSEIASVKVKKTEEKTIDIGESLEASDSRVFTPKNVNKLIEQYGDKGRIAVTNCLCRQNWEIQGEPCRLGLPLEAHLWLGKVADHVLKYKLGKEITKEEALELIEECNKKGGINHIWHNNMDLEEPEIAICNCCWDCCASIGNWNRGMMPIRLKTSYLSIIPDESKCVGCGTCIEFCPTEAISLKDEKAVHKDKLCIGCGQCYLQCPEGAVELIPMERMVFLPLKKKSKWEERIKS
ncbi:MAG: 4Fe-4S dicluster domain-containing protein [Promethearchaeota archaeon]|nr:MAG: 4Fe-4S dicluster domain-containing protein [Candidatus Lokiarchaeota archaeon]